MLHLTLPHEHISFGYSNLWRLIQGKDVNLFQPAAEFLPMIDKVRKCLSAMVYHIMYRGRFPIFCSL